MAEAIAIACIYILPFLVAITIPTIILENVLPAIRRKRARRKRNEFNRQIHG